MFFVASAANPVMKSWVFWQVENMSEMLVGSALSNANYSDMLLAIVATPPGVALTLDVRGIQYTAAAADARAELLAKKWMIEDGGQAD